MAIWLKVGGILGGLVFFLYLMFMGALIISSWISGVV